MIAVAFAREVNNHYWTSRRGTLGLSGFSPSRRALSCIPGASPIRGSIVGTRGSIIDMRGGIVGTCGGIVGTGGGEDRIIERIYHRPIICEGIVRNGGVQGIRNRGCRIWIKVLWAWRSNAHDGNNLRPR